MLTTALRALLLCLAALISLAAAGQSGYFVNVKVEPFTSVNVAKRVNATLVHHTEVDKLPKEAYAKLVRNKAAMARVEQGLPVGIVKAEPTVARAVRFSVEDGTLSVYADRFKYKSVPTIEVFIVCPDGLKYVYGESSSNILSKGCLPVESLTIKAKYAMSVRLTVSANHVTIDADDRSDVWLTGSTSSLSADVRKSSNLRMLKLTAGSVSVSASGASTAQLNATNTLTINATGGSQVTYYAPTASVSTSADASSAVHVEKIIENLPR